MTARVLIGWTWQDCPTGTQSPGPARLPACVASWFPVPGAAFPRPPAPNLLPSLLISGVHFSSPGEPPRLLGTWLRATRVLSPLPWPRVQGL